MPEPSTPAPRRLSFKKPDPGPTTHRCGHPLEEGRKRTKQCTPCARAAFEKNEELRSFAAIVKKHKRLPDGSEVAAKYDQATRKWTGTLKIVHDGVPLEFSGSSFKIFNLLGKLDRDYRKHLLANGLESPP